MYERDVAIIAGVLLLAGYSYSLTCFKCENHPVYGTGQGCGAKVISNSGQVKEVQCSQCMISKDLEDGGYTYYRGCGCTNVKTDNSIVKCCSTDRCNADLETASRQVTAGGDTLHQRTGSGCSIYLHLLALILTAAACRSVI